MPGDAMDVDDIEPDEKPRPKLDEKLLLDSLAENLGDGAAGLHSSSLPAQFRSLACYGLKFVVWSKNPQSANTTQYLHTDMCMYITYNKLSYHFDT